jgi:hypothetical protein
LGSGAPLCGEGFPPLLGFSPEGPCEEPCSLLGFCPEDPCEELSPIFNVEESSLNKLSLEKKSKVCSIEKRLKSKEIMKKSKLRPINERSLKMKKINIKVIKILFLFFSNRKKYQ